MHRVTHSKHLIILVPMNNNNNDNDTTIYKAP